MRSSENKRYPKGRKIWNFADSREPDLLPGAKYQGTCKNSSNPCIGSCNRCSK